MVKEQIDLEVGVAYFELYLAPHEREPSAQLEQELLYVSNERGLDLRFAPGIGVPSMSKR